MERGQLLPDRVVTEFFYGRGRSLAMVERSKFGMLTKVQMHILGVPFREEPPLAPSPERGYVR